MPAKQRGMAVMRKEVMVSVGPDETAADLEVRLVSFYTHL